MSTLACVDCERDGLGVSPSWSPCSICYRSIFCFENGVVFIYPCFHRIHAVCALRMWQGSVPHGSSMQCPECCWPWSQELEEELQTMCRHHHIVLEDDPPVLERDILELAPLPPTNTIVLCCRRDDGDARMAWSPHQYGNDDVWTLEWQCMVCMRVVGEFHPSLQPCHHAPSSQTCAEHGPCAIIADMVLRTVWAGCAVIMDPSETPWPSRCCPKHVLLNETEFMPTNSEAEDSRAPPTEVDSNSASSTCARIGSHRRSRSRSPRRVQCPGFLDVARFRSHRFPRRSRSWSPRRSRSRSSSVSSSLLGLGPLDAARSRSSSISASSY